MNNVIYEVRGGYKIL